MSIRWIKGLFKERTSRSLKLALDDVDFLSERVEELEDELLRVSVDNKILRSCVEDWKKKDIERARSNDTV